MNLITKQSMYSSDFHYICKMKHYSFIILVGMIVCLFSHAGCSKKWTEKEKQEFAEACSRKTTIEGLGMSFTGFAFEDIEHAYIARIHNGQVVDSLYIRPNKQDRDSLRCRYYAYINKTIYLKDTFHIIVPEKQTFVLSDMKMVMWPQFTMFSEGYGCVMGEFSVDGEKYERNTTPDFMKEGFKFSWEK